MFCSVSFPTQISKFRHLKFIDNVLFFVCLVEMFGDNFQELTLKTRTSKLKQARRPKTAIVFYAPKIVGPTLSR